MELRSAARVVALVLASLAVPLAAESQPARKAYRMGYISARSSSEGASYLAAFRHVPRELGYRARLD